MNNKNVEVIAPTSKTMCLKKTLEKKLTKACAYCRVSTDNEDQKTSYDSQRIHYKNMIEENPDWEFVGIYADEGITGTQTKKREQFNQMMSDALNGKIDLILAKSISRFARNTVDTLNCVRLLREHNVDVYFEKENIHTLGLSNELFLTLYSAFAQAESESISENVKAGVRMKMKRGELVGKYAPFGYSYDKEKDIITPDESKKDIVTYIFEEYSKGVGFRTIALNLNSLGIPSPSNLKWCHASVRRIIINEKYVGDLKTGKYYTENVLTHKKKVNYGEKEQFFTSHHHEPIISRELWDKCQEILTIRSKIIKPDGNRDKFSRKYAFSSKIFCGICGERFIRRSYKIRRNNKEVAYWICRSHRNKIECSNLIHYKQEELEDIFVIAYNKLFQDSDKYIHSFMKKVNEVINEKQDYDNQKKIKEEISKLENKLSNLIDLQLEGSISKEILNQKNLEISNKIKEYEQQLKNTENIELTRKQKLEQIDKISNTLKQYKGLTKFNEEVFNTLVDKIIIGEKLENGEEDFYKIKFILKTGKLINENLPNGKLDIGTNFGKYGFTITKQELEQKEDYVTAYVLQRYTYRGKDITEYHNDGSLYEMISNGTFDDIYVGDYIVANNIKWLVADIDNYLYTGDKKLIQHHVTVIPETKIDVKRMNATATTSGGYLGSEMVLVTLPKLLSEIETIFGSEHILSYRAPHSKGLNETGVNQFGVASGTSYEMEIVSRKIDLMSEINVYGTSIWSSSGYDVGADNMQYALFQLKPELRVATQKGVYYNYWLKGIANQTSFVFAGGWGESEYRQADQEFGVRPRFLIG